MNMKRLGNVIFYISLIIATLITILLSSTNAWIVWISTILGIMSSKMASSGKLTMFLFDIVSYIFYISICLNANYFGELTLSLIIILINLFCLVEWSRHQKDNTVIISKLNKSEINFSLFCASILLIIYSITLYKFNSDFAFLNALSTISYLLGSYFCYRRSVLQFYSWIFYEIVFIALWLISAVNGDVSNIIFLIGGISELIYDILGICNWQRLVKMQRSGDVSVRTLTMCKKMKW